MPSGFPFLGRRAKLGEILISQNFITQEQLDAALTEHQRTGMSLGQVLIQLGYITDETLQGVLGKQLEISRKKRLGEMLVDQGYITNVQLEEALKKQKAAGQKLGRTLVELGFLEENRLLDVLAAQLDFQHVVLDNFQFDPEALKRIPEDMARSYKAIPLYMKGPSLIVAIADPTNLRSLDHLKFKANCDVEWVIATEPAILAAIDRAYKSEQKQLAQLLGDGGGDDLQVVTQVESDDEESGSGEGDSQAVKVVNLMLQTAIREGASDIHFEPLEMHMRVRYRIDGSLTERQSIPKSLIPKVINRLKLVCHMRLDEKRKPQDGRSGIMFEGRQVDFRFSSFPVTMRGGVTREKMVVRVLNFDDSKVDLKKLGFNRATYDAWVKLIQAPNGIILVTGPTGSGKSTTLYACVKQVATPDVNIITMEDPVEINLPGISQGQINNPAGFTFAEGMRAILRQDPDIIMLGEMRDKETSEMAVQAALTGHLVYSTLHTNDAAEAYTRLVDIGVEPFLLAASIRGVLAQRLVRRICDKCKAQIEVPEEALRNIGIRPGTPFFQGKGCPACQNSGYKGRVGLFELLIPDEHINAMVYKRESAAAIKEYAVRTLKMPPLRRDGLEKALAGLTTLEEVLSAT